MAVMKVLQGFFSTPQFWATLLGAGTAFLLGMVNTWRNDARIKRDAGNLALITLAQMYSIAENLRYHIVVKEPIEASERSKLPKPWAFMIRVTVGLPRQRPSLDLKALGFLVDSHDPDVLNRLLGVERAFNSMLDIVDRHSGLQTQLQEKMSEADPTGRMGMTPEFMVQKFGVRIFIEIDDPIMDLHETLGETCDFITDVGAQLRRALTLQFPGRSFVRYIKAPRSRRLSEAPDVRPRTWRRIARWLRDIAMHRIPSEKAPQVEPIDEPKPPEIIRFIKRSFD
jgi:hypothetical protein